MKRSSIFLVCLLFLCGYCAAQPAFRYKRQIGGVKEEGWYVLTMPGEMFQHLNRDLTDLRLYSLNGTDTLEIPYLLSVLDDKVVERKVDLSLFNESYRDGLLYLTFELLRSYKVNSLRLEFDDLNYFAHVTIEGSDDRLKWFEIAKGERIVSIKKQGNDYTMSSVRIPLSSYRYLRLAVNSDTRLHFKGASFAYDSIRAGKHHNIPLTWQVKTDKDNRLSVVDIRMGEYGPVSKLHMQVKNDLDYYRNFSLEYVRDSVRTQKGWIRYYEGLFDGYLTSFEVNSFDFPVAFSKDMRLVIRDRDNAPLTIGHISAEGPDVEIICYLKPGDNFAFYGAGWMRQPAYDLMHFQNKIPEKPAAASLGAPEAIVTDKETTRPLFENPIWLWGIMGIMIGGLGLFTIKMMRSK